jgi:glycosyltransferase involved in cell wall biosynthesis
LRICLIASSRYPIREPFAGGLESMTATLARGLADHHAYLALMLESALDLCPRPPHLVSVSGWTAAAWRHVVDSDVVPNGLELRDWPFGEGGGRAVWSGRIVPEKAPHLAVEACRLAGVPLVLAGPVQDRAYFERELAPLLGGDVRHVGHLGGRALSAILREASVALVTPAWDEPYGLVAAEAMASGTPVAGFVRGGLSQVVSPRSGVLVGAGDVAALAEATCGADTMVERYLDLYTLLARRDDAA